MNGGTNNFNSGSFGKSTTTVNGFSGAMNSNTQKIGSGSTPISGGSKDPAITGKL